ncbi:hypothetical protein CDD83_10111 [Cordyceps sp. RAO-2017]|nr:hypothetical protein CDD83_10111 [Cordyceps sp. RAO-2017]
MRIPTAGPPLRARVTRRRASSSDRSGSPCRPTQPVDREGEHEAGRKSRQQGAAASQTADWPARPSSNVATDARAHVRGTVPAGQSQRVDTQYFLAVRTDDLSVVSVCTFCKSARGRGRRAIPAYTRRPAAQKPATTPTQTSPPLWPPDRRRGSGRGRDPRTMGRSLQGRCTARSRPSRPLHDVSSRLRLGASPVAARDRGAAPARDALPRPAAPARGLVHACAALLHRAARPPPPSLPQHDAVGLSSRPSANQRRDGRAGEPPAARAHTHIHARTAHTSVLGTRPSYS